MINYPKQTTQAHPQNTPNQTNPNQLTTQLTQATQELDHIYTPHPLNEWHEEIGNTLWYHHPINEPPYCGTPHDNNWPYEDNDPNIYWTHLPNPNHIHNQITTQRASTD